MKTYGTYLVNDPKRPLRYGPVEPINPPRQAAEVCGYDKLMWGSD